MNYLRRFICSLLLAGGVVFGGLGSGTPGVLAAQSIPNLVESTPITGQFAHDFSNACVAGYYGTGSLRGNHSESDLAVNPTNGNLLGASKFFFGTSEAGYSDFSTQYLFHLGSYAMSANGSLTSEAILPGYADGPTCQGAGDSAGLFWTDSTDPNVTFNSTGDAFAAVLPFTLYTNAHPNGAIFVNKWNGSSWSAPVLASPLYNTNGIGQGPDKQWVATYFDPSTQTEYVNACWTVFNSFASQVFCSQSTDGGKTFWNAPNPVQISAPNLFGPFNTYVYPRYDATGTLYVTYMAEKHEPAIDSNNPSAYQVGNTGQVFTIVSHDHGATFSTPTPGPTVNILPFQLPNTTFRDGIAYSMYASQNPATPGRLYVATEDYSAGNANVYLYESTDGGQTWSGTDVAHGAVQVNTNPDPSDQFQPTVTADAAGNVAVAWYDRRNACPSSQSLTPGALNTCLDTYVQFFTDTGSGSFTLTRNGANLRASQATWDPQVPVTPAQPNCADDLPHPDGDCTVAFIGDYFGAALGSGNLYVLNVSTHDFGGNPDNDQQQVLQIVPIPRH